MMRQRGMPPEAPVPFPINRDVPKGGLRWKFIIKRKIRMDEDLIKDTFIISINKQKIKRNITVIKIVLIVLSIYILFAIYVWVTVFSSLPKQFKPDGLQILKIIINPFVLLSGVILNILSGFFVLRGNLLINQAISQNDALVFNKGYNYFYRSSILALILSAITLAHAIFNCFILNK